MPASAPPVTKTLRAPAGRMAYTDVGSGPPVVLLHGNPTSARLFRYVIRDLSRAYRCIAPDYLGFGRSDAPASFSYRPPAHATLVETLLRRLQLNDITLVLHDWGGPIGLSYALRHPSTVRRLVLANTWAWPLTHRPLVRLFGFFAETHIGRVLIERYNAFARVVMPLTTGRLVPARPDWIDAYAEALGSPVRRRACWTFARSLLRETDWLRTLWTNRHRLGQCPALLCWGMADPAFGTEATLRRWESLFSRSSVRRWKTVGHYLPEEIGADFGPVVRSFLENTTP